MGTTGLETAFAAVFTELVVPGVLSAGLRRRAHDERPGGARAVGAARRGGRGGQPRRWSTSTRSGTSARTATRAARRTAASPAGGCAGASCSRSRTAASPTASGPSLSWGRAGERLRPPRGRHALRRRGVRRGGPRHRRGRLHDGHERLPGVDDRPLLRRPAHHLHLPAHRQLRRERRGDGVRPHLGARGDHARRHERRGRADGRARLAGLADRLRRPGDHRRGHARAGPPHPLGRRDARRRVRWRDARARGPGADRGTSRRWPGRTWPASSRPTT